MHVLDANELFGVTSYTYDKIMEIGGKNGPDAFALYFRLMKQARIQQTNQTRSLNEFLQKSMGWGRDRLQNAKKILNELGLIDYIQVRDEKGRMETQYIRVNYLIDEQKVRSNSTTYNIQGDQLTEKSADGKTATNALSTKDKCLKYIKENKVETLKQKLSVEYGLSQDVIEIAIVFDKYKAGPKIHDFKKPQLTAWVNKLKKDGLNCDEGMIATLNKSIASGYQGTTPIRPREIKKKEEKPTTVVFH